MGEGDTQICYFHKIMIFKIKFKIIDRVLNFLSLTAPYWLGFKFQSKRRSQYDDIKTLHSTL